MKCNNVNTSFRIFEATNSNNLIAKFCKFELHSVLEAININPVKDDWAIGGSAAMVFYGVDFGRVCHDVDIIVPSGHLEKVVHKIAGSPLFQVVAYANHGNYRHIAFRIIGFNYTIDIVEEDPNIPQDYIYYGSLKVVTMGSLIDVKRAWGRKKDLHDIEALTNRFDGINLK